MLSIEYSEAIVEVLEILQYSDDNIIEKIPKKLIEFWQRNKSTTYKPNLDHSKIYLNYLCNDEEKNNIKLILKDNEEKYQQELGEKYNADNIFKKYNQKQKVTENVVATNMAMVEYKEPIFKKIINIIKRFFHIH